LERKTLKIVEVTLITFKKFYIAKADGYFPSYFWIDNRKKLVLSRIPISVTLGLFDESFLVDPSSKEERVIRGTLTCASDIDGTICLIDQVIYYHFIFHS
jgi:exosome complex RNA-binding protein Rrp42 (RNase PH superfamily)